jgi:hypothetical protein
MSLGARKEYLEAIRLRYQKSSKSEKTRILDEFCKNCLYSRKHATRLLNRPPGSRAKRSGAKRRYGPELIPHLKRLWFAMEQIGPKKMAAALPVWLRFYSDASLTPEQRGLLEKISASTIERMLRFARTKRGISATRPGTYIKARIPISILDWNIGRPGYLEGDTVAHCGETLMGEFVNSLTVTDIFSTWTENRAVFTKASGKIINAFKDIERGLPFEWLGLGCDNGSEFLNYALDEFLKVGRTKEIQFTRSRPDKKNDQCYVEQKNWTHVRQLFGYDRLDEREIADVMNEIYRDYWNPFMNFFIPSIKLVKKTRIGGRMQKTYDKPKTPYQRLMESVCLTDHQKTELEARYEKLNPFELKQGLERKMKEFSELLKRAKATRAMA